jgi:hypothetical protein
MEHKEVHVLHLHTVFRDGVHWWKCCVLPSSKRLQHGIINNVQNFAHTTYAYENGLLHIVLLICRSLLLFLSRTASVLPSSSSDLP